MINDSQSPEGTPSTPGAHSAHQAVAMILNRALDENEQALVTDYLATTTTPTVCGAVDVVDDTWSAEQPWARIVYEGMFGSAVQSAPEGGNP